MRGFAARRIGGIAALTLLSSLAGVASAEPTLDGFALNRHQPPEPGGDWFENESLDFRGTVRPALGLVADFSQRPLILRDAAGAELVSLVHHQFFYHVQAGLVLGGRLRLGASLPLLLHSQGGTGTLANVGSVQNVSVASPEGSGTSDARLAAELRLTGQYEQPFALALGIRAYIPLGQQELFASDGRARFEGRVLLAGQPGWFSYAAHAGVLAHLERDDFAAIPFGTDLTFGLALGVRIADGTVTLGPEVYGSTVISDSGEGMWKAASTPVEATFGAKFRVGDSVHLGAAVGTGLTQGLGASQVRILASLEWLASLAPDVARLSATPVLRDLDGDGVMDEWDVCPAEAGVERPLDRSRNGCPDAPDSDGDQILDDVDACPAQAGRANADRALSGCPPRDADGDGILDSVDACPGLPGSPQRDPSRNGCPGDSDADGIWDQDDACPHGAGALSADPTRSGCPAPSEASAPQ